MDKSTFFHPLVIEQELSNMYMIKNSSMADSHLSNPICSYPFWFMIFPSTFGSDKTIWNGSILSPFFIYLCPTCLILGRRLKGTGQTRNGEEEQPSAPWGPGERGERLGKKDVMLESGNAVGRAHSGEDLCDTDSTFILWLLSIFSSIMPGLFIVI